MPTQGKYRYWKQILHTNSINANCANKILHISTILEGRSWLSKGMAYVEYESNDHVVEAIKMMDGGKYFDVIVHLLYKKS